MKKIIIAAMVAAVSATPALAADVKIGTLLGYTGPIESLTPDMAAGAELAMKEVTDSGTFMGGSSVTSVRGDSTCIDSAAATAAAAGVGATRDCEYDCRARARAFHRR